jgi:membrane protease subunit (stomatin/prohibitin family)
VLRVFDGGCGATPAPGVAMGTQVLQENWALATTQQGCRSAQQPINAAVDAPNDCHNIAKARIALSSVRKTFVISGGVFAGLHACHGNFLIRSLLYI